MNLSRYWKLRMQTISGKKSLDEEKETFLHIDRIKTRILNEMTFFRLFFDLEKLKHVLFNKKQRVLFEKAKIDWGTVVEELNRDGKCDF